MFLETLEVHHLRFTCTAQTTVHFGPQAGAQIRGALWEALQPLIGDTDLLERFLQLETPDAARGNNPARPFSIRPPIGDDPGADRLYPAHTPFTFGINLFGNMLDLFPYIVQAVYRVGQQGVGYGRGRFYLDAVDALNPLTGATRALLVDGQIIGMPTIPVNAEQVAAFAHARKDAQHITLDFITPTQLRGRQKTLLSQPDFDVLIPRIVERCQMIAENYAPTNVPQAEWRAVYLKLRDQAPAITLQDCQTRWVHVRSGSRRANSGKKISGFTGKATYAGDIQAFIPWLVWGQSLQVGKNTVKGDGWYTIV